MFCELMKFAEFNVMSNELEIMMNKTELMRQEMLRTINYFDVTDLFQDAFSKSLCGKLLNLKTFDNADEFKLTVSHPSSQVTTYNDSVNLDSTEIRVPPLIVACHPLLKFREWRKDDFDLDNLLLVAISKITTQLDYQLLKLMVAVKEENPVSPKNASTMIVHGAHSVVEPNDGEKKPKINAYVVQPRGSTATSALYDFDEKPEYVLETQVDNQRVLTSQCCPCNADIYCDDIIGTICSLPRMYATPDIDLAKLRAGLVIGGEFGLCVHDNPRISYVIHETDSSLTTP